MKFLILTCNTGGGHNSTAAAISEYLLDRGHETQVLDCLKFLPPAKAKVISEGHVLLYRKAPKLFGVGYRMEEAKFSKLVLAQCESCADAFYQAVTAAQCDAIINVHVFSALIMTAARARYGLTIPGYFVSTDYTCHPGVSYTDQDLYFIPHPELAPEFTAAGIAPGKLVPSGIPVRAAFSRSLPRQQARRELDLPQTGHLVLLASGSMGAGPVGELAQCLDRTMAPADHLVVVCGTNEKLKKELEEAGLSHCVRVLGFTRDMDRYLDAADLILTKAGGLSTTEALMKHLPLVYVDAVPGCETRNLDFMVAKGYARTADSPEALARLVCSLLAQPEDLTLWRERLARDFSHPAMEVIYPRVCTGISQEMAII